MAKTDSIRRKAGLLLMIAVIAGALCGCARIETFSEVTGGRDSQISYVSTNNGVLSGSRTKKLIDRYQNAEFRRWNGSSENTADTVYHFYDSTGQIIFTVDQLGNRNVVKVTTDNEKVATYQVNYPRLKPQA